MLGKLLKYELQATARAFLPVYALLMVMAIFNRLFLALRDGMQSGNQAARYMAVRFGDLMVLLATMFYVFIIAAVFIITAVIIVQRFHKNLMGDEGYLMFTLPVRPWENIVGKLIVAVLWSIISSVVVLCSLFVIAINPTTMEVMGEMFRSIGTFFREYQVQGPLLLWLTIANVFFGVLFFVLHIYAAIAIGQLSNNHKVLCAFGAYIGISIAENIISSIFSIFLIFMPGGMFSNAIMGTYSFGYYGYDLFESNMAVAQQMNLSMGVALLLNVMFVAALFFVTNYLLTKKLNLE